MKRMALAALVLLSIACKRTPVPRDTQLWRIETAWQDAGNSIRTANAEIVIFRSRNEYVEVHLPVIERPDGAVYVMARGKRTAAVGHWEQSGSRVDVHRTRGICGDRKFTVSGNSVTEGGEAYSPVTRLIAPEFETYVNAAKQSGVTCGEQ